MASVQGEINRIATAKSDIESAIEYCGVDVPNTALISTYSDYIRAIPTTIFSQLNYDSVGGTDKYIESISQSNGVISAATGTTATISKSGLMSKADKVKLDSIAEGADSVSFSQSLTTGVKIGSITISGIDTSLYCSDTWIANALDTAGYVAAPTSDNANMVWKCDSSGKPAWRVDANTTYKVFVKSGSTAAEGLVPKPSTTAGTSQYLREDCTWNTPPNYYPKRKFTDGLKITDTNDSTNYVDGGIYVPYATTTQSGVISNVAQTFAGAKTFSGAMTVNNTITFGQSNSYGIRTSTDNYGRIGESSKRFYQCYVKNSYSTNGFWEDSDERLKNIIKPIKVDLDEVSKLRKIYYIWKNPKDDQSLQLGMIAQDVQRLYPELVSVDKETGYLSLAYDRLSVLALETIDVLYKKHKKLKERVDELEKILTNRGIL